MSQVRFCENNFQFDTEDVVNKLKNEGVDVEVESCLGYCGECAEGPFALVDDELIQAETADELYDAIIELC